MRRVSSARRERLPLRGTGVALGGVRHANAGAAEMGLERVTGRGVESVRDVTADDRELLGQAHPDRAGPGRMTGSLSTDHLQRVAKRTYDAGRLDPLDDPKIGAAAGAVRRRDRIRQGSRAGRDRSPRLRTA
jgi:hypothetical protein